MHTVNLLQGIDNTALFNLCLPICYISIVSHNECVQLCVHMLVCEYWEWDFVCQPQHVPLIVKPTLPLCTLIIHNATHVSGTDTIS